MSDMDVLALRSMFDGGMVTCDDAIRLLKIKEAHVARNMWVTWFLVQAKV